MTDHKHVRYNRARLDNTYMASHIGPLHTRHFCPRYFDIVIKRLKKNFFFKILQWNFKIFIIVPKNVFNTHRKKNIGWKMSFYLFIKILCAKMSSVYWALRWWLTKVTSKHFSVWTSSFKYNWLSLTLNMATSITSFAVLYYNVKRF